MRNDRLRVTANGRRLAYADGAPFFYLADTAWELVHAGRREDILLYLDKRRDQGFTALQTVALAEMDGLRTPNAYGRRPLLRGADGRWDASRPEDAGGDSYWDHLDFVVQAAADRGLYVALLPTWGDKLAQAWGKGPEIFTPDTAYAYGSYLGRRYAQAPNILWVLGGDRVLTERRHFEIAHRMAEGLRAGDAGCHLITFHPQGGRSSSQAVHREAWLDFNMVQSGHDRRRFNYEMIGADWAREPAKPVLDGEPGYEDHPDAFTPAFGYLDAVDARQAAYMALCAGACGHTYGHHSVWGMVEALPVEGFADGHFCMTWRQALDRPGAWQMRHVKALALSRDFLSTAPRADLIAGQLGGVLHIPVLLGRDFLFAYTAQGLPIRFAEGLAQYAAGWWYDPREGKALAVADVQAGLRAGFVPPSGGRGNDWVLVLDAAGSGYAPPGQA